MAKWDFKTINDYICGNDLECDIDLLENDSKFMSAVIRISNDKNIYNLCSDELKKDFEFCKYIINIFVKDEKFISFVANEFIKNSNNDFDNFEMSLLMKNLLKDKDLALPFGLKVVAFTEEILLEIEMLKQDLLEHSGSYVLIDLGFCCILDEFAESEIILNHFAKYYINKIFFEENNFTKLVISNFESYDEMEKYGIIKFLVDVIRGFDSDLADYVFNNVNVLNDLINTLNSLKFNWNSYAETYEREKYELIFDNVFKYLYENNGSFYFSSSDLIYFIGEELGIKDKIQKYDVMYDEAFDGFKNNKIDKNTMSFMEMKLYNNVKNMMIEILNSEEFIEYNNYKEEKNECKIYDFNLYIKRNIKKK